MGFFGCSMRAIKRLVNSAAHCLVEIKAESATCSPIAPRSNNLGARVLFLDQRRRFDASLGICKEGHAALRSVRIAISR